MALRTKSKGPEGPSLDAGEVCFGRIMAPFGLRGEVKLYLYNPDTDLFDQPRQVALVWMDGRRRTARMTVRAGAGKRLLATIDGVSTPEAAASLVDSWVVLDKTELPGLEEDTWYHHQLLGLPVRTLSGSSLGVLREIHESGPFDMWVVRGPEGESWIPYRDGAVLEVNPPHEIVVADDAVLELGS